MNTIVDIARSELALGIVEDSGKNKDSKGRIALYNKTAGWKGADGIAYCATFDSYCAIMANLPIGGVITLQKRTPDGKKYDENITLRPGSASCAAIQRWFAEDPEKVGVSFVPIPHVGDLVFIDTEEVGDFNHLGIVEAIQDGYIITIEGNTSNDGLDDKTLEEVYLLVKTGKLTDAKKETNDPTSGGVHRKARSIASAAIKGYGHWPENIAPATTEIKPRTLFPTEIAGMLKSLPKEQVKGIQVFLNAMGAYYPGEGNDVDGKLGTDTTKAIERISKKWFNYKVAPVAGEERV